MLTYTALTTLSEKSRAEALGEALEGLEPSPTGVGVFEVEDGKGLWEVGGYFLEVPNDINLALLAAAYGQNPLLSPKFLIKTGWPRFVGNCHLSRLVGSLFTAVMTLSTCHLTGLGS